ncbi:MAG: sugar phosphate isomerase/epimerase family protein [Anaerolineae bacterium]
MSERRYVYSVFTKPWRDMPIPQLGAFIRGLGFDGVELPVRPGFQVQPEQVGRDLPIAARQLAAQGVRIYSVAGPADQATVAACAEAGVPTIRVMAQIPANEGYLAAEARLRAEYERLLPLLERCDVQLGVQNHCDGFVPNALGLARLLEGFDRRHIAAVWDAAHEALNGMWPEMALDVVWPHLCMVNLKNGYWRRSTGPEAQQAAWQHYWTGGRHGLASWPRVAAELKRRDYRGIICLSAEYSNEASVNRLIAEDIAYARELLSQEPDSSA